jgi:hypothetical protein
MRPHFTLVEEFLQSRIAMDIRFACPTCDQHIAIDEAGTGLQIECPNCQSPVIVPEPAPAKAPTLVQPRIRLATPAPTGAVSSVASVPVVQPEVGVVPPPLPVTPGIGGDYRCNNPSCGAILLESQLSTVQVGGKSMQVCPKCRLGVSKVVKEVGFWARVPGTFIYPFRENGAWILATSTLFLALLEVTQKFLGIGSFVLGTIAMGYFGMMFIDIIRTTANDDKSSMELPDFSGMEEIRETAAQLAISGLLILSPALICVLLSGYSTAAEYAQRLLPSAYWRLLALGFTGMGLVYYPMGLLAVAMFDTVAAVNPVLVVPAISKTFCQYVLVLAMLGVMWLLREVSSMVLFALPWSWRFACYLPIEFYSLYTLLVTARLLGVLYRVNSARLGWFE